MAKPTLSVVMPNYNHAQYLRKSLSALTDRDRPPDELIVIDDGSTDNSWEIIQEFASKHTFIHAYKNEKNLGVVPTVDKALHLAKGDYICGAAADDYVLPGFIEKTMDLLEKHPEAGLCCTIGDWQELHTGLNWHMGAGMTDKPAYLSPETMMELERRGKLFIAGHTVAVKRSALFEAGKFPVEAKYGSDWFTYNLIGFRYGICVVPEVLAVNQIDATTSYNKGRRDKASDLKVMRDMLDLLKRSPYPDAVERMRKCGALYVWGWPMLKVLVTHSEYRHYLTPLFLRKNIWHITKLLLKRTLPASVTNFLAGLAGYRVKASCATKNG